jgi:hypothetical protein
VFYRIRLLATVPTIVARCTTQLRVEARRSLCHRSRPHKPEVADVEREIALFDAFARLVPQYPETRPGLFAIELATSKSTMANEWRRLWA